MADLSIGQSQGVFITNIIKYFCPYTQKVIQTVIDVLFQKTSNLLLKPSELLFEIFVSNSDYLHAPWKPPISLWGTNTLLSE